jgi:hypothetical protein
MYKTGIMVFPCHPIMKSHPLFMPVCSIDCFNALQTSPRVSKVRALTSIKTDEYKIIGHTNSEYDKNRVKIRS